MRRSVTVHGKIILSGEYAVVFGYHGIAVPSKETLTIEFHKGNESSTRWDHPAKKYAENVARLIEEKSGVKGLFFIEGDLPIGKGMGASTAIVIGCSRAALGENCESTARKIEDEVNPGNSGIDFAVIWRDEPVLFKKGDVPKTIDLPRNLLQDAELIDTGSPDQSTPELVAWVRECYDKESREESRSHSGKNEKNQSTILRAGPRNIREAIETIGACTDRILNGEDIKTVIRDHHRAQVTLGVVPGAVQKLIAEIERGGGAAKVLGAGSRTGGGGMVLAWK